MGGKSVFSFILLFTFTLLFGTSESTFLLFNKFIKQGILKSIVAPKCSPSLRQLPSLRDITEYRTCFQLAPRVNGSRRHPDQDLRVNQVIIKYGYNLVTYENVTTEDGYILTVHRIVGSSESAPRVGKPSVLLFHGLGTAADAWVLQSDVKKNLPMMLVDAGYDVWLANARGTDLSIKSTNRNAFWDMKYWNFSFHEVGIYDLPAIIDFMIHETGNAKIFYIGHSYGAKVYAAALSEKPELNDKIEASVWLAPSIFQGHSNNPLRPLFRAAADLDPFVQGQLNAAIRGKLTFGNWIMNPLLARFCTPTALKCGLCGNVLFFLYGFDAPQIDFGDIPNILSKHLNTISFKTALHMGQNIKTCDFRKYDYGRLSNTKLYGNERPPHYNLTNIRAPVHIYYGYGDNFATVEDMVMTRSALPQDTLKGLYPVQWKLFNNLDFLIAKNADKLVYTRVLDNLKEYSKIKRTP